MSAFHTCPADLPFNQSNYGDYNPRRLVDESEEWQAWWVLFRWNDNPETWGFLSAEAFVNVVAPEAVRAFKKAWAESNDGGKDLVRFFLSEEQKLGVVVHCIVADGFEHTACLEDFPELEEENEEKEE